MGPNGAGKTTLLRVLAGLLVPDSGSVTVDGSSVAARSRRDMARKFSIVRQTRSTGFGFRVLEFVMMGFHAQLSRFALEGQTQREAAERALERMGVGALAHRTMSQLSAGEVQRVAMARTLVAETPYWLLDEPTANLDLAHQLSLLGAVREHVDQGGAALCIVHDPNLVEPTFDRVLVLAAGSVVVDGPPQQALTPGLFEEVFDVPMRRLQHGELKAWTPALDPPADSPVEDNMTSTGNVT